jgi:hypothetical protein
MFIRVWFSRWRAGDVSWSLDVFHVGLRNKKIAFLNNFFKFFFFSIKLFSLVELDPDSAKAGFLIRIKIFGSTLL